MRIYAELTDSLPDLVNIFWRDVFVYLRLFVLLDVQGIMGLFWARPHRKQV